ncbi:MAG: glycoside hydrolase [Bacteroidota bacterium]|nr:glycoside hydrolase [Bacteroidota bacterium]
MKKLILSLLLVTAFLTNNSYANGGFCSILEKVCQQKNINLDEFSNFFQDVGVNLTKATDLSIYTNIYKWFSTPYRYGGSGTKGIDCSNYVFKLMTEASCSDSYATSQQLANLTEYVDKEELKEGDLVFFNVHGGRISHVGVYLQDGKFTHSCSSKGVTVSSLDDPYWSQRYCRAGRIIKQ